MAPEIIYLHGMGGSPKDFSTLLEHLPGMAMPLPSRCASPLEAAEKICAAILERVGERPFALCGYSMGGRLGILAAHALSRRNRAPTHLALLATGFGEASPEARARRLSADLTWAELAESNIDLFWENWYSQPLFASFRQLPQSTRALWMAERKSINISELVSQLRHLSPAQHDSLLPALEQLREKGISTLYIAGEQDKKYLALSEKLRDEHGFNIETIPAAGHILPLEAPRELATMLRKFFHKP